MYNRFKNAGWFRKLTALTLSLIFVITMLPVSAYAETETKKKELSSEELSSLKTSEWTGNTESSAIRPESWSETAIQASREQTVGEINASEGKTTVLLIQSTLPWRENTNTIVLDQLKSSGYISGYTVVSMENAASQNFFNYSMVMLANDQTPSSYESYELIRATLEDYVFKGGTVLFGACDNGWADGELSTTLPGGVGKYLDYSYYNYIVDSENPFVTGALTGGRALTDDMLYNNYCSHTCFYEDTLPDGSLIILRSSNTNDPTLVRYNYGSGNVLASGLTWEHCYTHQDADHFSQNSYDDLMVYALSLSGAVYHNVYNPKVYEFNYLENSPAQQLAEKCSLYSLLAYRETKKKGGGTFVQAGDGDSIYYVGQEMKKDGFTDLYSYNYDSIGTTKGNAVSKLYNQGDHSICFTIGHRRIKNASGDIQDQIAIVFRGTNKKEWYGNFDVTGFLYDENIDYHQSFQDAVDTAMDQLNEYISTISAQGRLNRSSLSILLTGHSRGAAVANMMAHELTDVRDGNSETGLFSGSTIKSVYAYTFATPNAATVSKIKATTNYDNIFNYCFTDDFVPRLPLEAWSWGKYGRTYWATADNLYGTIDKGEVIYGNASLENTEDPNFIVIGPIVGPIPQLEDNVFTKGVKNYFSKSPEYNSYYAKKIAKTAGDATNRKGGSGVYNYYNYKMDLSMVDPVSLHFFMRWGLGGTMQGDEDGTSVLIAGVLPGSDSHFRSLSLALATGGKLFPALDFTHQCGSYYIGMQKVFNDFKYCALTTSGYAVTPENSVSLTDDEEPAEDVPVYNESQKVALKGFLEQTITDEDTGNILSNADILGWDPEDPATWEQISWNEEGDVTEIDLFCDDVHGNLDVSGFTSLKRLDVTGSSLSGILLDGCSSIEELNISDLNLENIDLSSLSSLQILDCSNNSLTTLDLSGCTELNTLYANNNQLRELNITANTNLLTLSIGYNYLDLSDETLAAAIRSIAEKEGCSLSYTPQNIRDDVSFNETDVNRLKAIASFGDNASILNWDLNDPATFKEVNWILKENAYHLYEVDLSGLSLTGAADFSGCTYLTSLLIPNNEFTSLNLEGCSALSSLMCAYNRLDTESIRGYEDIENLNALVLPQKNPVGISLDPNETEAFLNMDEFNGLEFKEEALFNYPEITWEEKEDGYYHVTALDLSETCLAGDVDLSVFPCLTAFKLAGTDVETIILPEGLKEIPAGAFENCELLYDITFPAGLASIGDNAFRGDTSLYTLTMPASLRSIGANAFEDCTRLLLVQFEGDEVPLGEDAFKGCRENLTLSLNFIDDSLTLRSGITGSFDTTHFTDGGSLTWSSSKPEVADVSEDGTVAAFEDGAALITAVSGTGFSATGIVIVYHNEFILQPKSVNILEDFMTSLSVQVKGEAESYQWQISSDGETFTDLSEGLYEGIHDDTLSFRVTANNADKLFRCKVAFTDGDVLYSESARVSMIIAENLTEDHFLLAETKNTYEYFRFTPEVSGNYRMYSRGLLDTYGTLKDTNGNELTSNDDSGLNANFSISYYLEAGQTYILQTRLYGYGYGTFSVKITSKSVEATRVYGSTRYQTALKAADEYKAQLGKEKFDNIIIAYGQAFPDALGGSYLAAKKQAPILYVRNNETTNAQTIDYVQKNLTSGGTVYLLGGESAVPASVESKLNALGINVIRLSGSNRYRTNLAILQETGVSSGSSLLVVTGKAFADALSASSTGLPMLMVNGTSGDLTTYQKEYLEQLGSMDITIIGGTGAVSEGLETALSNYGSVRRIAGGNRYETSRLIAETYFSGSSSVVLAYGQNYPDGLSAGPVANYLQAPVLLARADEKKDNYQDALTFTSDRYISEGYALGGPSLIRDDVFAEIMRLESVDDILTIK